ncbi:MAG: hypothetical protein NTV43_16390 [Methylococcales bacterium]|nr:hypothetical protein [Methylococcales bacterium]
MDELERTEEQKKAFFDAIVQMEVFFANHSAIEWPSLFSNIMEPKIKDLPAANKFYASLTDQQIEMRLAVRSWEGEAWNSYEGLMGCSLLPLSKSIEPKKWAIKELENVEKLLTEGENHILSPWDFYCPKAIPELYNKLVTGEWEYFISLEKLKKFQNAEFRYLEEHGIDSFDPTSIDRVGFRIYGARPRKKQFLNKDYFLAQEIQALIWYKEFLKDVAVNGISFYDSNHYESNVSSKSKGRRVDINQLQRSNDGYEAITASFHDFATANDRPPKWSELMAYMAEHPPHGFTVQASFKGMKVSELVIEGMDKPLDRDAFRKRYERYFKKMDIKPDNK